MLTPISLDRPVNHITSRLGDILQHSGVFFEKNLGDLCTSASVLRGDEDRIGLQEKIRVLISQDLKPQLLALKNWFSDNAETIRHAFSLSREDEQFMRQTVQRFLGHIEQMQEPAAARAQHKEAYQMFGHSVVVENVDTPVQFKIYYPRKKRDGEAKQHHRIAMLLHMDRLGLVRIDLACVDTQLHINFFMQDDTARTLVSRHMDQVRQSLSGCFDHVHLNAAVSRDQIVRFHDEDPQHDPQGRIDLRA